MHASSQLARSAGRGPERRRPVRHRGRRGEYGADRGAPPRRGQLVGSPRPFASGPTVYGSRRLRTVAAVRAAVLRRSGAMPGGRCVLGPGAAKSRGGGVHVSRSGRDGLRRGGDSADHRATSRPRLHVDHPRIDGVERSEHGAAGGQRRARDRETREAARGLGHDLRRLHARASRWASRRTGTLPPGLVASSWHARVGRIAAPSRA